MNASVPGSGHNQPPVESLPQRILQLLLGKRLSHWIEEHLRTVLKMFKAPHLVGRVDAQIARDLRAAAERNDLPWADKVTLREAAQEIEKRQ